MESVDACHSRQLSQNMSVKSTGWGRMTLRVSRSGFGLMAGVAGLTLALSAMADNKSITAYKWTDDQGVVHYGDSIPPQYAEKAHEALNKQGLAVGHSDAAKTAEELAKEARDHDSVVKQQQHDSFLIATYTSIKDIESLRDVRLEQLQGQRTAADAYVENLRSRLVTLQGRARHFRPYSTQAGAHRLPDDLAEDLVHTLNEMRTQTNALTAKNEEIASVRAQFDSDIQRYRELHEAHAHR
jgi:uncharacterized protein DUF4124